ncbi:helix-turn-helix domain-containing protein [Deminuibacter soli]|uniref:AraC family transcriptional regulator n=1 Tax=Deminuibacter soli TaxID=2291815 RepID=A0A3E1NH94_9BACT|nr:helix-turn-helix domain-containing protein [Deminuibacter soli]RFM27267.1 AraC family transcriptional regulator [Deminuibacter soli]
MRKTETAGEFLERQGKHYSDAGQFNVYKINRLSQGAAAPPLRRDFYKISLVLNTRGIITYADKSIHINNNALVFSNPLMPYFWQSLGKRQTGYFCMFTEAFVTHQLKTNILSQSPLFKINSSTVVFPSQQSTDFLAGIFEQMRKEIQSAYPNKYDLLRSYVHLLMHEALKITPAEPQYQPGSSAHRIAGMFLELLERQFPVTSPQHALQLKNAGEYAEALAIHTNHLNKILKEVTGKTTSVILAERLLKEAKALLLHSDWDIASIGYCLGFEHPANFNIFFKKQTGETPNHFRKQAVIARS